MFWPRGIYKRHSVKEWSQSHDAGGEPYQAANHGTHVEDAPEPSKVLSLLRLIRVRNHDSALSGPQETGTNTKPSAGEQIETTNAGVHRDQQTDGVDAVSSTSKCKCPFDSELVHKGTTKDAEDRECAVKSRVLSQN